MNVPMTTNMLPIRVVCQNVEYFIEIKMVAVLIVVIQAVNNQQDAGKGMSLDAIVAPITMNM